MPDKDDIFFQRISDNQGIILKIAGSYCSSQADREDLAQEIFYTLWKGSGTYNPNYKFTTWMYRVALNVAISFYRANKKFKNNIPLHGTIEEIAEHPLPDDKSHMLQQRVAALNELDKALMLLYFDEKSYREIAEVLGITETNVATKISRIKEKLKKEITTKKDSYGRH